jgi:hypothetical protein
MARSPATFLLHDFSFSHLRAINYLLLPLAYYTNVFKARNFPFISQNLFFENGTVYDQNLILNPDFSLNHTAVEIYGQPWQATSNVLYNMGINLSIGAIIVHIILWHGDEIWGSIEDFRRGVITDDAHYKAMQVYREVPMWWYIAIFIGALIVSIGKLASTAKSPSGLHSYFLVTSITGHSHLPVWALIVAVLFGSFLMPFYGAFYAITGFSPTFTNLFQMLGASLVPGSSQANMYFELYSSNTLKQSTRLLADLKLGQYTKCKGFFASPRGVAKT